LSGLLQGLFGILGFSAPSAQHRIELVVFAVAPMKRRLPRNDERLKAFAVDGLGLGEAHEGLRIDFGDLAAELGGFDLIDDDADHLALSPV
jgi:hypothetical protein